MRPRPPKSAPPRSRGIHSSAEKEIEEWAFSDNEFRHSGQLTENVTEERLLRARLMELSKERFKVLSKHVSEKQSFSEKQRRKAAVMRKHRISSGTESNRTHTCGSYSTFHSILAKGDRGMDATAAACPCSAAIRPKTVQFEQNMDRGGYISTGVNDYKSSTFSGGSEPGKKPEQNDTSTPMGIYTQWSRPSTAGTVTISRSISSVTSSDNSKSWRGGKPQMVWGGRSPGVTSDPRYSNLEKCLAQNYIPRTKYNFKTILERLETVQQPKQLTAMEEKRKLEMKIKEFMLQRGIDFR